MRRITVITRRSRQLCLGLVGALLAAVAPSCYTTPITGRNQLIVIGSEAEIALGVEAYQQALERVRISENKAKVDRVYRVGLRLVEAWKRLVPAKDRVDLDWEFTVIEDDGMINAWALPGGKVAVYTGILKLTEGDDALLATVMGHEIAHVTHRHGAERMTETLGVNVMAAGIQTALSDRDPETVGLVMTAFGLGYTIGRELPFGREQESESDRVGLLYMAKAGYHPSKSIEFWKRISEASDGGSPPEFLSTHPSHRTRLDNLRQWQAEAIAEYEPIAE